MAKTTIAIYDKQQIDAMIGGIGPDIQDLKERVTEAETDISGLDGRVDTVETDLSGLDGRVDTVETDLNTLDGHVDTVETNLNDLDGRVDTVETDLNTLDGRVDTVETDLNTLDGRVDTVETDLNTLDGRVDTVETSLNGLAEVARTGDYDDLTNKPIIPPGAVLYSGTGQNTDGAITQKGTTDALALKANLTDLPTSGELVPDYSQAATGQVLTRTATGTGWTTPAAGVTITNMQTYYQITY